MRRNGIGEREKTFLNIECVYLVTLEIYQSDKCY